MRTIGAVFGAVIGTILLPGVGTAIGAALGEVGTSVAMGDKPGEVFANLATSGTYSEFKGGNAKSKEQKAAQQSEIDLLKGNLLNGNSSTTATEETSISEVERRRRAQIVDAKNNMNNLLSGASSDSSTSPLLKTTLGAGSLLG